MRYIHLDINIEEYGSISDLNVEEQKLLQLALENSRKAYAPYSEFHVGAALLLEDGKIVTGNNQENVAYPSGLCAERVALFYAQSQFPDEAVKTVAISATSPNFATDFPVTPCGSCRQVIAEHEILHSKKIRILMMGSSGKVHAVNSIEDLLPLMFRADALKKR